MGWQTSHVRLLQAMGVHWIAAAEVPDAPVHDETRKPAAEQATAGPRASPSGRQDASANAVAAAPAAPPTLRPVVPPAAPARPADGFDRQAAGQRVAALDWPALREAVANCQACTLCETRRQTVFGVGDPAADWMVVGEAPGEQEDLKGEPFVGAAGRLLDQMLLSIGLARHEPEPQAAAGRAAPPRQGVYIANTLKCRPPGNRNPQPEELARCEPFLLRQIDLVRPRVILAMGRFAVQSLLRSAEPIGRLRGRVHRYHDVPLVVTYHPAYLLRNPVDKARAWEDLCLAASLLPPPRG